MRSIAITIVVALGACTQAARDHASDAPREIARFNQQMIDATRRMDDAAILALWEDDGASLLPGAAPLAGKAALRELLATIHAQHPRARMASFEMSCEGLEVASAGDVAHEYCREHQVVEEDGQPTFDGRGRMLFVLHRGADGVWRLRREMWQQAP
jgi:uncharacterized protein (TIGR02246 family)